jgi:glycosyltransferase involved in cell wall biosynthesis
MRIWQLDPANLTPHYNRTICNALADIGHEVTHFTSPYLYDALPMSTAFETELIYFSRVSQPWLKNRPRLRQVLRGIAYPFGHLELARRAAYHPPDILHIQWSRLPRLDYWLIRSLRRRGIPIVHTVHDVIPLFDASLRHALGRVYESVDALIVHADNNRRDLLSIYPNLPLRKITTLPMIVPLDPLLPAEAAPRLARERLNLPLDVPVVGFFGLIKAYKGLDVLAAAWPAVQAALPEAHLLIGGRPDSPSEAALTANLKRLPHVHVADYYIPQADAWQYHMACDVMVFPYRNITQSGALLTAMQYSVAIIVTDVGGLPELVDGNGWVIPPENQEVLAATLINALADRVSLQQMGIRSHAIIQQRHSPSAVAHSLTALYERLIH